MMVIRESRVVGKAKIHEIPICIEANLNLRPQKKL